MQGVYLPLWIAAPAALVCLFILSEVQFRHLGLAFLIVLAPLPAAIAAWLLGFAASASAIGYLFGFLCCLPIGSRIVTRKCDGDAAGGAGSESLLTFLPMLLWPAAVAIMLDGLASAIGSAASLFADMAFIAVSVVSAAAILLLAGRFLSFDETAITRINRVRERRERPLDALAFVVQPRWGWSVSGIGLVIAGLGYFNGGAPLWKPSTALMFAGTEAVFALVGLIATRSARQTVAFVLVGAVLNCLAIRSGAHGVSGPVLALAIAPTLLMSLQSASFARRGDKPAVATLRSFEHLAIPVMVFAPVRPLRFGYSRSLRRLFLRHAGRRRR